MKYVDLRPYRFYLGAGGGGGGIAGIWQCDDSFVTGGSFSGLGLVRNAWNTVTLPGLPADSLIQVVTQNTNTNVNGEAVFIVKEADTPDPVGPALTNYQRITRGRNSASWLVKTNASSQVRIWVGGSFFNTFQTNYKFLKKFYLI